MLSDWDVCAKIECIYRELQQLEIGLPGGGVILSPSWSPPQAPYVKINFDAAYNQDLHHSCTGFVIRDECRHVMGCGVKKNLFVSDAFAVEALACIQALQFGRDMGFQYIAVEGDSRTLILKTNRKNVDRSEIGTYIAEILCLNLSFISVSFNYAERATNCLAHSLAKLGFHNDEERY